MTKLNAYTIRWRADKSNYCLKYSCSKTLVPFPISMSE